LEPSIRNTVAMPKKRKPTTPTQPAPKPLPEPLPPNPPPIPVRVTSTIPAHLYEVRPRKEIVVTFTKIRPIMVKPCRELGSD
jgi:hypothetical protein